MKIVHLVLAPRLSGAEVLVSLLLPAHAENGCTGFLVSLDASEANFHAAKARLQRSKIQLRIPNGNGGRVGRIAHLLAALKDLNPDVIFAHSIIPSAYARCVAAILNIPVVTVLHDASRDDYHEPIHNFFEASVLPRPKYIVAVASEALANYYRRFGNSVSGCVIENAISVAELNLLRANRSRFRAEVLKVTDQEVLVVSVGRFTTQKNQVFLVNAYNSMSESARMRSRLILVGISEDAHYEMQLRDMASMSGGRVQVFGNRSDSLAILACADVYCMPSLSEGFSLAFLEGLALGIDVIANDIMAFRFAKSWSGVSLISVEEIDKWSNLLERSVNMPRIIHSRPLEKYEPISVAAKYEHIAEAVALKMPNIV